jgi:Mg2+-importing ATPase
MATSANFGNMFSMAGVSVFLPFLPLLPKQILLMNLLTDFPEMTISTDRIDDDFIIKPLRLNIRFIAKFMTVFGLISSIFDFLTFGTLLWIFHATTEQFRVGWFLESIISAAMVVLVIRTRKSFYKSRSSNPLLLAILSIVAITLLFPLSPLANMFELFPLPLPYYLAIGVIVGLYIVAAEFAKKLFYKKFSSGNNVGLLANEKK